MTVAALERKQLTLTDFTLLDPDTGSFGGYASCFHGVDAYGDSIAPGAYTDTIPKFLSDGFIGWGHDDRIPVAYPTKAHEDDHGLYIEAVFHSTTAAQEARQITVERQAAGKRMGLSIGYYPVKAEPGPDGTRILRAISLVEVSLVLIPADDAARVASVKASETTEAVETVETRPYPNEHACRLRDPGDFEADSFRRTTRESDGKEYSIIMGRLKGADTMTEQAYRYGKDVWAAAAARAHCDSHDGASFEPASDGKETESFPGDYRAHNLQAVLTAARASWASESSAEPDPALQVLTLSRTSWEDQLYDALEALTSARGALEAFHLRALAQSQYDRKVGRELSEANRQKLRQLLDAQAAFDGAFDVIRQLLADTEPAPKTWTNWIEVRALESRLRLRGIVLVPEGVDGANAC